MPSNSLPPHIKTARSALLSLGNTEQTGAQIRALLDRECPELDIRLITGILAGPGALSKFLADYMPDIVHNIGKNGGDILYHIGTNYQASSFLEPNIQEENIWAAFATRNSIIEIAFDLKANKIVQLSAAIADNEYKKKIDPVSDEEFLSISKSYADQVPPDKRVQLEQLMHSNDFAFHQWIATIKEFGGSYYHDWGLFRVNRIIDIFRERLEALNCSEEQVAIGVGQMRRAQEASFEARRKHVVSATPTAAKAASGEQPLSRLKDETDSARHLLTAALNQMSLTELRRLEIPFGAIIDLGISRKDR